MQTLVLNTAVSGIIGNSLVVINSYYKSDVFIVFEQLMRKCNFLFKLNSTAGVVQLHRLKTQCQDSPSDELNFHNHW